MDIKCITGGNLRDLSPEELKFIDGGKPDKSTSFYYDLSYGLARVIGNAWQEMSTWDFWEQLDDCFI